MAILDYSAGLSRGGLGGLARQVSTAQGLQGIQANRQALEQRQTLFNQQQEDRALQQQQAQQQQDKIAQAQELYRTGDVNKVAEFAIANPELGRQILNSRGIVDAQGVKRVSDRFASVYSAANPRETLAREVQQGRAAGLDMSDSEQILNSNLSDDEIRRMAGMTLASIDPGRQQAIQQASMAGQPEPLTAYEQVKAAQKEVDQQLRARELELKALQAQQRSETNELQKQKLQQDIEAKKQQVESTKSEKAQSLASSISNSNQLLNNVNELLGNDDYIDTLTGISGKVPFTTPGESTDAEVVFDQLTNSLTLGNLGMMSGVLTDRDIQVLRSAASGLEKGMSKEKFKQRLRSIKNRMEAKVRQAQKQVDEVAPNAEFSQPKQRSEADILREYGIE